MTDEILKIVGTAAVIVAAVAWLIRSLIQHYLNKDIDKYKSQIQAQSTKEIEELKAQLQIITHERQISFSSLYTKRAELLEDLYALVNDLYAMSYAFGGTFIFGTSNRAKVKAENAYEKTIELNTFFSKNKIYFSKELSLLLERFMETISGTLSEYLEIPDSPEERIKFDKEFSKILPEVQDKLSSLKTEIENEFRVLLGVNNKTTT